MGPSPPTQAQLRPSVERDDAEIMTLDLTNIDENPMLYFLSPADPPYSGETMDFEMDFDAGIEDAKHPPPIVRSVSPSSLGGLSLPPPRIPTPPRRSTSPDSDRDMPLTPDDGEDYMYLAAQDRPHSFGLPFSLRDFAESKSGSQDRRDRRNAEDLLSPTSRRSRARPRSSRSMHRKARSRTLTPRRSPHAWREPSPDVWAIEEETEEELVHSDMGDSVFEREGTELYGKNGIDIPAAKPKKRVRFVLPVEDE